jgi:hypothetical protein
VFHRPVSEIEQLPSYETAELEAEFHLRAEERKREKHRRLQAKEEPEEQE